MSTPEAPAADAVAPEPTPTGTPAAIEPTLEATAQLSEPEQSVEPTRAAIDPPPMATSVPATATLQPPPSTAVPPTATPQPPAPTATPEPPPPPEAPVSFGGLEQQLLIRHNQARAEAGLAPFASDAQLTAIARARVHDMAANSYFSHTSPSGETVFSLLDGAGYDYALGGENIARNNYPTPESVDVAMDGFMGSGGHRANILEPAYNRIGIASEVAADGMKYFVVVFASR
jgi:uncharacterized protein YkwD